MCVQSVITHTLSSSLELNACDQNNEEVTTSTPRHNCTDLSSINFSPISNELHDGCKVMDCQVRNTCNIEQSMPCSSSQSLTSCSAGPQMCSTPVRLRNKKQARNISSSIQASRCIDETEDEGNCKIVTKLDEQSTCTHSSAVNLQYVSKHAILISKVIGDSTELELFDKLHLQLKSGSESVKRNKHLHQQYETILAGIQVKVLREKSNTIKEIKKFEKDYFSQHQQLPSSTDNQAYIDLCRKLKGVKALLRSWEIAL